MGAVIADVRGGDQQDAPRRRPDEARITIPALASWLRRLHCMRSMSSPSQPRPPGMWCSSPDPTMWALAGTPANKGGYAFPCTSRCECLSERTPRKWRLSAL
eukprot:8080157-Pyramimonas_sp.AAC.1